MEFSAQQIAGVLNGTIEGNVDIKITKLSKIEEGVPGSISFFCVPVESPVPSAADASVRAGQITL